MCVASSAEKLSIARSGARRSCETPCANDACRPCMAASSARASASCRATAAVSSPVDWLEVPALDITRSCVLWGRYQGRVTTGCRQCERVRRQNAPMALDQIPFLMILAGGLYLFLSDSGATAATSVLISLAPVVTG